MRPTVPTVAATVALVVFGAGFAVQASLEDSVVTVCVAAGLPADACRHQHDGKQHGDASDDCGHPSPILQRGIPDRGRLVPFEDAYDNWALLVFGQSTPGPDDPPPPPPQPIVVSMRPAPDTKPSSAPIYPDYDLEVWGPAGDWSVPCAVLLGNSTRNGTQPESVVFQAHHSGVYTVRVLFKDQGLVEPSPAFRIRVCDPFCHHASDGLVGYEMSYT
ncbi:MAG: hypothetical protein ACT4PT_06885 [Methanobacteriota archaeon]